MSKKQADKTAKAPFRNSTSALVGSVVSLLSKFIVQRIFIENLGIEYAGLNSIFANVISVLNIAELGIGVAIIYNLYEPIKTGNMELIKSLLNFYKRAYRIVAVATFTLGLAIMPFLHLIIHDEIPGTNIYLAYSVVLVTSVASYLLSYRQSVFYACQRGHVTTNIQTLGTIITSLLQALILLTSRNFYLYLASKLVTQIFQNLAIHYLARLMYPEFCDNSVIRLNKAIEKDIFQKMRALLFHKVGSFMVLSTDNIIISIFINVTTVGFYSNYQMIISAMETVFTKTFAALTPTVGNLLVEKNYPKNYQIFRKINQVNFIISSLSSAGIVLFGDLFIALWLGDDYIISNFTVIVLAITYFQKMMRSSFTIFKEAAGIFHEDRFVPIIESLINIVVSVILVQWIGLPGVFIGTFISSLALWFYSYPKFVYKKLFNRSYRQYATEMLLYCLIFIAIMAIAILVRGWIGF